jgi:hypothetical protein
MKDKEKQGKTRIGPGKAGRPGTGSDKVVSGTSGPGTGPVTCPKEPDQARNHCDQNRIRSGRARRRPGTGSYEIASGTSGPGTGPVSCPKEPDQAHDQCGQNRIRL